MIWYLIGLIGVGSFAGRGEGGRRSWGHGPPGGAAAPPPAERLRAWYQRCREIRLLNRSYVRVSSTEALPAWRRPSLQLALLLGPVCAVAGAITLTVTAALARSTTVTLLAGLAAAIVLALAVWRTAAALALAANVLGLVGLVVSRTTMASLDRGPVAVTLLALGGLVAVSALVTAQREPPHEPELTARGGAGDEVPIADPMLN